MIWKDSNWIEAQSWIIEMTLPRFKWASRHQFFCWLEDLMRQRNYERERERENKSFQKIGGISSAIEIHIERDIKRHAKILCFLAGYSLPVFGYPKRDYRISS